MGAQSCMPLGCCRISIHMWLLNTKGAPQHPSTTTTCPAAGSSSFRKHSGTQWDWVRCPLWCLQDTWGRLQPMGEGTASCMSADSSEDSTGNVDVYKDQLEPDMACLQPTIKAENRFEGKRSSLASKLRGK